MNTIPTDVIVISLPRTGTLSMSQMLIQLGIPCVHVPGPWWQSFLENDENVRALSDTPMFRPSAIQHTLSVSDNVKFIYMSKTSEAWVSSMMKVNLSNNYNNMHDNTNKEAWNKHTLIDFESLFEILEGPWDEHTAGEYFDAHKQKVESMIPPERLLIYSFNDGWEPLCTFLGMDIPDVVIPHLNQNTMFDTITQ